MKKSPLGLAPKFKDEYDREELDLKRGIEILEAMWRYYTAGYVFPTEWSDELDTIQASMWERRCGTSFEDGTVIPKKENT